MLTEDQKIARWIEAGRLRRLKALRDEKSALDADRRNSYQRGWENGKREASSHLKIQLGKGYTDRISEIAATEFARLFANKAAEKVPVPVLMSVAEKVFSLFKHQAVSLDEAARMVILNDVERDGLRIEFIVPEMRFRNIARYDDLRWLR